MADSDTNAWGQYLRRVAVYMVACFQITDSLIRVCEKSAELEEIEWLRIYNAATRASGVSSKHFYPSPTVTMALVGPSNDDLATATDFKQLKTKMNAGLGGAIVHRPTIPKTQDELTSSGVERPSS